jgi:four helix bundle protein
MHHAPVVPDPAASASLPVRDDPSDVPVRCRSGLVPVRHPPEPLPDCERLDAYRVAVEFQVLAASMASGRRLGALRGQLDRASVSIVLNIAEGSGRFAAAEKAHFYLIARGSALECVAALSLMSARSLVRPEAYRRSRSLLTRIIAMLTRLAAAMQARARGVRDAAS